MPILGREKRGRKNAERLKDMVSAGKAPDPWPAPPAQEVVDWGWGIEQILDPTLGPYVNDCIYAVGRKGLYFQHDDDPETFYAWEYEDMADARVQIAVDGRTDVTFLPKHATGQSEYEFKGFGFVESFGGMGKNFSGLFAVDSVKGDLLDVDASLRARLSSRDLSDVPPLLQVRSEGDAPDTEVLLAAELGSLALQANLGVVFRAIFRDRLEPGEEVRWLTLGHASSGRKAPGTKEITPSEPLPGWVAVTTWGLRWYLQTDGIGKVVSARRDLSFRQIEYVDTKRLPSKGKNWPAQDRIALLAGGWAYLFHLEPDPTRPGLLTAVREAVSK